MTFYLFKDNKKFFCFHFCGRKFNEFQYAKIFAKSAAPLQHVSDHRLKLWNIRDIVNISCNTINTLPLNTVLLPIQIRIIPYFLSPIHSAAYDKLNLFAQPVHTKLLLNIVCSLLLKGEQLSLFTASGDSYSCEIP